MIVLDASWIIALFNAHDAHHEVAEKVLLDAPTDQLVASPITVAEVLVAPARAGQLDKAEAWLHRLGVRPVELEASAPARLAVLRAATGLKLPDCCVLLTARQVGAPIATFDDRLRASARNLGYSVVET